MKRVIAVCLIAANAALPLTMVHAAEAKQPAKAEQVATKVNINTADAQSIADNLMGIGIKKAEAIVAHRKMLGGRYTSLDQLLEVKGIGEKTLAKLKPYLTL